MQDSNALVLEVLKQDDSLKMSLFEQKEAASTLRHYSQHHASFIEINSLCDEILFLLNKAGKADFSNQAHVRSLVKAGTLLWDHLFTRSVKDKLKSTQISDLILSLDEELIHIPWELAYDGSTYLCLNFNLGRLIRTKQEINPVQYRSHSSVLKMLILANPTNDLKSSYLEGVNIKNQFDRKRNNVRINFKSTNIDKLYVKKNISEYDIIHFAGHCEFDADNPKHSGWVLSDGRFAAHDISVMGSSGTLPSLVFSNACHSALNRENLLEKDYQERNFSIASAFLHSGVRHYIGAIRKIEDPVSLAFSKEFYSHLLNGDSVGGSLRMARLRLVRDYGLSAIHWASYLLYGDPNFVLFKTAQHKQQAQKKNLKISAFKKKIARFALLVLSIMSAGFIIMRLPTLNPNTFALYLKSQRLFEQGSNQEVIQAASRIIQKDPAFLSAYALLADTYFRIGNRDDALKYYFNYALASEKKHALKNLASAYLKIGWFYHLEGDYQKALDFYNKALVLAVQNKDALNEAAALRKIAVWNIDKRDYSRALELLTKSSEINRQRQQNPEHRYNLACDYFDIALVFSDKNDFSAALDFYNRSREIFEKLKLKNELSDYYFNLGEIALFEKQYQKAMNYYLAGLRLDEAQGNKTNLASDYNMVGELYVEMNNLKDALNNFERAAFIAKEIKARPELAGAYYNLGLLYKKMAKGNLSREYLRQAQEIYKDIDEYSYQEVKKEFLDNSGPSGYTN